MRFFLSIVAIALFTQAIARQFRPPVGLCREQLPYSITAGARAHDCSSGISKKEKMVVKIVSISK